MTRNQTGTRKHTEYKRLHEDVAALAAGVDKMRKRNGVKRAEMSPEELHADDAERAERLARAKASHEAWMKDPPWFVFYDPYASVLGTDRPRFLDHHGKELQFRNSTGGTELLGLAIAVKEEMLAGAEITHEQWRQLLSQTKSDIRGMKEDLPVEKIKFVDVAGNEIAAPEKDDIGDFAIVSFVHRAATRSDHPAQRNETDASDLAWLRTLWCLMSLREIDGAVLAALYEDAGDGITASIRATEALWYARSLTRAVIDRARPAVDARALGRQRGTEARKNLYARAQKWAWDRWMREAVDYQNKPSKAAPVYVRLIAQQFQTSGGTALTVTVDTVKAWLKSPPGEE